MASWLRTTRDWQVFSAEGPATALEFTSGCTVLHTFLPSRKQKLDFIIYYIKKEIKLVPSQILFILIPGSRGQRCTPRGRGTEKGSLPSLPSLRGPGHPCLTSPRRRELLCPGWNSGLSLQNGLSSLSVIFKTDVFLLPQSYKHHLISECPHC